MALSLDDDTAVLYAGALHAIARADGEVGTRESTQLTMLVAAHSPVTIDAESLFFDPVTPESFAASLRKRGADLREIGRALAADAAALASADGDLNSLEGRAIVRFLKPLGCTSAEIHAVAPTLDEWVSELG